MAGNSFLKKIGYSQKWTIFGRKRKWYWEFLRKYQWYGHTLWIKTGSVGNITHWLAILSYPSFISLNWHLKPRPYGLLWSTLLQKVHCLIGAPCLPGAPFLRGAPCLCQVGWFGLSPLLLCNNLKARTMSYSSHLFLMPDKVLSTE